MNPKSYYLLIMTIGLKINAQESRLRFLFMGDLMQHERQMRPAYDSLTQKYDYQHCYQCFFYTEIQQHNGNSKIKSTQFNFLMKC